MGSSRRSGAAKVRLADRQTTDATDLLVLTDQELVTQVRKGDDRAFGELFSRHADAARAFCARTYGSAMDPDDLTAEAFFRVLQAVRRDTAQIDHTRAYLFTVIRRVAMEWSARRRDVPVDDDELLRHTAPSGDQATGSADRHLIARAFTSLPERWRSVLWSVEVEGERPAVVAGHFGLSANATAALARRAREGLRAAYLQAHLADTHGSVNCRSVVDKLGAFTAGGVRGAEKRRITEHLASCDPCTALHDELTEVCAGLRAHASHVGAAVGFGSALSGKATGWLGLAGKAALFTGRAKIALAATAVAGIGAFGVSIGPMLHDGRLSAAPDYDGKRGDQVVDVCTECTTASSGPLAITKKTTTPPPPPSKKAVRHAPLTGAQSHAKTGSAAHGNDQSPVQPTKQTSRHKANSTMHSKDSPNTGVTMTIPPKFTVSGDITDGMPTMPPMPSIPNMPHVPFWPSTHTPSSSSTPSTVTVTPSG